MRIELAKANRIKFRSEECPSLGPCAGTCDKCDQEAEYLRDKLALIPEAQRIIPDFISVTPRAAYTPEELIEVLRKDEIYYLMTGGGIVFGGGEPLLQPAFIHEVCQLAGPGWQKRIETSLMQKWFGQRFLIISEYNLFMYASEIKEHELKCIIF